MRPSHKHRLKMALIGLGVIVGTQLLIPNPACLIFGACELGFTLTYGYYSFQIPIVGYMVLFFLGTWLMGIIGGSATIIASFKQTKFEHRYCTNCKSETEQFKSKTNYKKGFKPKLANAGEWKANTVSEEYVCEQCGGKNIVEIDGVSKTVADLAHNAPVCKICDKKMEGVDPTKDLWYCEQDRRLFYGAENRVQGDVDRPGPSKP